MIGYLRGKILLLKSDGALLDVGGVGYEVTCSTNTLDQLHPGLEGQLWIFTHVREDALVLFGFSQPAEKELFLELIKVNGVGPKMAMKILSGAPLSHITQMIEAGDVKGLSKLPKVGAKTAEQLILSLKGKLNHAPVHSASPARTQVMSALLHLGFRQQEIERVVAEIPGDLSIEEGVRRSLAALSNI